MLKVFYRLTKPGIVYGNAITVVAGFFLASEGHIDFGLLLATVAGISLVIAGACVFNNYIDRGIDKKMARTKKRAIASGAVTPVVALSYASLLAAIGFILLLFFTNLLTGLIAAIGFIFYVVLYGWTKRKSVYGTLVGSVSGAVPPVVGYCAVTNVFDLGALLLFAILVFWQMPHFYAIAIYRIKDYEAAGLPVLPVVRGVDAAKRQILSYIAAFIIASISLSWYGYTGNIYLLVMLLMGFGWLFLGMREYKRTDANRWARKMFLYSLIVITTWSVIVSIDAWLP